MYSPDEAFSIVMSIFNEQSHAGRDRAAVVAVDLLGGALVLVDDFSTDGSREVIERVGCEG